MIRTMERETDHPRHVVAVTGFVMNRAGEILLVRVASRGWEMPGGRVELGEDLQSGLRREVEEESGCLIEVDRLVGVYSKLSHPAMILHLFHCTYLSGDACAREEEVPEVGWFALAEARSLVTHGPSAQRLEDALSEAPTVLYRVYRLPYEAVVARSI